jgi:dihydrofolate reductase
MHTPRISAIAAMGRNRELGRGNALSWRISEDLGRVKALTVGHPLIMGRRTYESIGRPLPGRTTIVVTRSTEAIDGCVVVNSIEAALNHARALDEREIFIFGGGQIYNASLPYIERLYLTLIDAEDENADTFFPDYEKEFTKEIERTEKKSPEGLRYTWVTLERTS